MTDAVGQQIVGAARKYVGTPFFHAGRQIGIGVDCAGLLLCVLRDVGLTDYEVASYGRQIQPEALTAALGRFCDRVDTHCPLTLYNTEGAALMEAGDFLLFAVGGQPQHLAISNGEGGMIHCHQGAGKVVEHGIDAGWMRRLVGVWRWRGDRNA